MLKNTEKKPVTVFTKQNFKQFNSYSLISFLSFTELEQESSQKEFNKIKRSQDPEKRKKNLLAYPFEFLQGGTTTDPSYYLKGEALGMKISLRFKENQNGRFIFVPENSPSLSTFPSTNETLEHFSITQDKRAFSFLLSIENQKHRRALVALYFIKDQKKDKLLKNISNFFYTNPLNARLGWGKDKVVHVNVCHEKSEIQATEFEFNLRIKHNVIEKWNKALENRLYVEYHWPKKWKPFSDLNQNCIYFTNDLYFSSNPDYAFNGINLSIHDLSKNRVITSDVFILVKEFQKEINHMKKQKIDLSGQYYKLLSYFQEKFDKTIIHEMGHFFQLDHKLKGPQTIMSYDNDEARLFDYDFRAIEYLYPLTGTQ